MNTYPNCWGGGGGDSQREKWSKAAIESYLGKIMGITEVQ